MKGIKFSQDKRFGERIAATTYTDGNINVEFNMPLSHIKTRCEKDYEEEINDVRVIFLAFITKVIYQTRRD